MVCLACIELIFLIVLSMKPEDRRRSIYSRWSEKEDESLIAGTNYVVSQDPLSQSKTPESSTTRLKRH